MSFKEELGILMCKRDEAFKNWQHPDSEYYSRFRRCYEEFIEKWKPNDNDPCKNKETSWSTQGAIR